MDIPDIAHYVRRLASFSRLISFDKQDGPFRPDLARPAPPAGGVDGRRACGARCGRMPAGWR